jgi:hypothetical protein
MSAKKPYQPPKFVVYGSLTEMTKANTMVGNKDGGSNNTRTG